MTESLDALVRRVDEDRWLASRFAPAPVRTRLIAVYALNYEIARTVDVVTQAAIGDIRLAWWREALAEIAAGGAVRAHPVVQAFAAASRETTFSRDVLAGLIDARGQELDAEPFATWDALESYVHATAGGVVRLALEACGAPVADAALRPAARAWGYAGLVRAAQHWRGRSFLPREGGSLEALAERAREAYAQAHQSLEKLPSAAFPALGYVALTPAYLKNNNVSLLRRQITLIGAAAAGRF